MQCAAFSALTGVHPRACPPQVEFTSVFMALFLVSGLFKDITLHVAMAGAWVTTFRLIGGLSYSGVLPFPRGVGGFFHLGELYILYLAGSQAYRLVSP